MILDTTTVELFSDRSALNSSDDIQRYNKCIDMEYFFINLFYVYILLFSLFLPTRKNNNIRRMYNV